MTYKLKVITTLPYLKVTLYNGYGRKVFTENISGALIPHFSVNQMDLFSRENFLETELEKGLYQMRLSLPYFNGGSEFDMPIVMDEFITMDKDKEYRLDCSLESPNSCKREIIKKQKDEIFTKI